MQKERCCPGGSGVGPEKPSRWIIDSEWLSGLGVAAVQVRKFGTVGELAIAFGIKDLDRLRFSAGEVSSSLTLISPPARPCRLFGNAPLRVL